MNGFRRYGVYAVPEGDLYAAGAAWLGWDSVSGTRLPHPTVAGLPQAAEEMTGHPAQIRVSRHDQTTVFPGRGHERRRA
jgi:hypothetical protein